MTTESRLTYDLPVTALLADDDTEESVMGSDLHRDVINEAHATLAEEASGSAREGGPSWYVSSQVTVLVPHPERAGELWQPKPDVFVVPDVPAISRTSYNTRAEGPMPPFVLEVASESTWRHDVGRKATLYHRTGVREYLVFDPTGAYLRDLLVAWHLVNGVWTPWAPITSADTRAVWESAVLGLSIRIEGMFLRFDHPKRGTLPMRRDLVRLREAAEHARAVAEQRILAAQRAREVATQRLAEEQRARQTAEASLAAALEKLAQFSGRTAAENESHDPPA